MLTINHFNLRSFDLNLLLAFDALMQELSVTRAAARLKIQQPAMSHALSNLRMLFDDVLFIRSGHVMEATARAKALHTTLHPLLLQIQQALSATAQFDPAKETCTFRLGMNGQAEMILLPALVDQIARFAPNIKIHSVPIGDETAQTLLDDDKIDLAIAHASDDLGRLRRERLYCEQYVCCFNPSQLACSNPITLEEYFTAAHGLMSANAHLSGFLDYLLRQAPARLQATYLSHNVMTLLAMAARAPLIASLQTGVATRHAAAFGLVISPLPFDVDDLDIDMIWHPRSDNDPAIEWLRALLHTCIS